MGAEKNFQWTLSGKRVKTVCYYHSLPLLEFSLKSLVVVSVAFFSIFYKQKISGQLFMEFKKNLILARLPADKLGKLRGLQFS